jgi:hypothetical protein
MPVQKQASWARLKVGILALFAMAILAVLIFLITGDTNPFESNATIYTYMADAAALTTAAPVNLDGIPSARLRPSGSPAPRSEAAGSYRNADTRSMSSRTSLPIRWLPSARPTCWAPSTSTSRPAKATTTISAGAGASQRRHRRVRGSHAAGLWRNDLRCRIPFSASTKLWASWNRERAASASLLVDETLYNNLLAILGQVKQLGGCVEQRQGHGWQADLRSRSVQPGSGVAEASGRHVAAVAGWTRNRGQVPQGSGGLR